VTRARGNVLQNALAAYLARWWVNAESVGAGRQGTDVTGTPGVAWECKTASEFKRDFRPAQWVQQSIDHAQRIPVKFRGETTHPAWSVPVVVYFPPGIGAARTEHAMAIMPMHVLMRLLREAQYTPATQETAAP
jgi:hypothetical protein